MKNILLVTLLVSQASSITWIISLEARLTERNPTVFLHPYDTPASDTPIYIAPPPDKPRRQIDEQILPSLDEALASGPQGELFP